MKLVSEIGVGVIASGVVKVNLIVDLFVLENEYENCFSMILQMSKTTKRAY